MASFGEDDFTENCTYMVSLHRKTNIQDFVNDLPDVINAEVRIFAEDTI